MKKVNVVYMLKKGFHKYIKQHRCFYIANIKKSFLSTKAAN